MFVSLVLLAGLATSWVAGTPSLDRHPPGTPSAPGDNPSPCLEVACGAATGLRGPLSPVPRGPTVSPLSGSPYFAANFSSSSLLVSDPLHPSEIAGFGTYEGGAVGVNSTDSKALANGTVARFLSADGAPPWTPTLLPGSPLYTNASSALCGFENEAAVAVAEFNGSIALLVTAGPSPIAPQCSDTPAGWALWLFVSPDAGKNWNVPALLELEATAPSAGPSAHPGDVTIGAPNGTIFIAYPDGANHSIRIRAAAQDGALLLPPATLLPTDAAGVRLTFVNGSVDALTWYVTTPGTLANHFQAQYQADLLSPAGSYPPASNVTVGTFEASSLTGFPEVELLADGSFHSPFEGRLYAIWSNGSGLADGSPAIVDTTSSDGGATWSAPINVSGSASAYDCCVDAAVGENGAVVVGWYGLTGPTNPLYRLSASVSFDGGAQFSPEFGVDAWTGNGTNQIGSPGLAAEGNSVAVLWTQYRSATPVACPECPGGTAPDREIDDATVAVGSIGATAAVNLSVSGIASAGATLGVGPTPEPVAGIDGRGFSVTAPLSFVAGGQSHYFSEWFGSNISLLPVLTPDWTLGTNLTACFVASQGSSCHATGAPGTLSVEVSPASATVTADGQRVPMDLGLGSILLPSGTQTVTASSAGFLTSTSSVSITPGNTTDLNLTLEPQPAVLEGSVSPAGARVTVDGGGIEVAADGTFSLNLTSGSYLVAAYEYGYQSYSATVELSYVAPTVVHIVLVWEPAHVLGIVSPANATLRVDGTPVELESSGAFTLNLTAGEHLFTATSWSYLPYSLVLELEPSLYVPLGIHLTPANGTLHAVISPSSASVDLDGLPEPTTAGVLNLAVPWGAHLLSASASGFSPGQTVVQVIYDGSVNASLILAASPGWIAGNVTPTNATVSVDGSSLNVSANGSFNESMPAGPYSLEVTSPGFVGRTIQLWVVSGESNRSTIALVPVPVASNGGMTIRPLSLPMLADGLGLDAAILLGVAVLFAIAQRRPRSD